MVELPKVIDIHCKEYWEAVKNSRMSRWIRAVLHSGVNVPETYEIPINGRVSIGEYIKVSDSLVDEVARIASERLGYPFFMRGEYSSGKFMWNKSCYVESMDRIRSNLMSILEHESIIWVSSSYIYVRRYIEPEVIFTIRSGRGNFFFPLAKEIRVFTFGGRAVAWCRYWPEDSVRHNWERGGYKLPRGWIGIYTDRYEISNEDIRSVVEQANKVAAMDDISENDWSVDFMKGADGRWYLIDMADVRVSWRPEDIHIL